MSLSIKQTKFNSIAKKKRVDQFTKDIVYGYVRKYQQFAETNGNVSYNMPEGIILIILLYYFLDFKFDPDLNHGTAIHYLSDTIVTKTAPASGPSGWSTCIFGEEVTQKQCSIFNIDIKWKKCVTEFIMGYITSSIEQSIKDWNEFLGTAPNLEHCNGIFVDHVQAHFYVQRKGKENRALPYVPKNKFRQDDVFRLSFKFEQDKLELYHNQIFVDTLSLRKHKKIRIGFSLLGEGDQVEIINYEFINNNKS